MPEETAYFALACFWKPDGQFGAQPGVLRTRVGYCGGHGPAPNYPSVNDHTEAVEVVYDTALLSYEDLLDLFWRFHDPCSCKKRQYMSAIFYKSGPQNQAAEASKQRHEGRLGKPVATQVLPLNVFHEAEHYHQKYYLRTYHRAFYESLLPLEDPVTSTRDARLNGYLSGHGSLEMLIKESEALNLNDDQYSYVEKYLKGELKPSTVAPFIRTVCQVTSNFIKKALGY